MNFIIFASLLLSIWFTIALYRVFLKLITMDKLLWLSLQWLVIFVFWLILFLFFSSKKVSTANFDFRTLVYIILAGIVLTLNWFLIMTAFRLWFRLSTFTPAYAILGNIFAVLIWYLFFKEQINVYNVVWLILWMIWIYFLSIK